MKGDIYHKFWNFAVIIILFILIKLILMQKYQEKTNYKSQKHALFIAKYSILYREGILHFLKILSIAWEIIRNIHIFMWHGIECIIYKGHFNRKEKSTQHC